MLHSGGQSEKWSTNRPGGDITLATSGVPDASKRGTKSEVADKWAQGLHNPLSFGGVPDASERGTKSKVAHKWAEWLHNPCHVGGPRCFRAGDKIKSGPRGPSGYITPAILGVPDALEWGTKSKVAQKWP